MSNIKALLVGIFVLAGIGIVIILLTTQTQKPNFDMNGTFRFVIIPACTQNDENCNPKHELHLNNGDTYQLLFSSATKLPNDGQHIEVRGTVTYPNSTICQSYINEKEVSCQPIGTVNVSSWHPK